MNQTKHFLLDKDSWMACNILIPANMHRKAVQEKNKSDITGLMLD